MLKENTGKHIFFLNFICTKEFSQLNTKTKPFQIHGVVIYGYVCYKNVIVTLCHVHILLLYNTTLLWVHNIQYKYMGCLKKMLS